MSGQHPKHTHTHKRRVWTLGPKGSVSIHCEAAVPNAISAAWDTHDNILVAQLDNKFSHIDLRSKGTAAEHSKDKRRAAKTYAINQGDEVGRAGGSKKSDDCGQKE